MSLTTILIIIVIAWIISSVFLITIICMNSSRLSRLDDHFDAENQANQHKQEKHNDG